MVKRVSVALVCFFCAWSACDADAVACAPENEYGKIELIRDTWGVAHVFAETDAGAMYGLGYASAQDRAFQMHYSLRIMQGRLAEVVGDRPSSRRNETALFNDRKMRTFGFYRAAKAAAEELDADSKAMLAAYSDGVNDYVSENRETLHPLFKETVLEPEAWTPADCLVSFWHLGQFFATDGTRELIHYRNTLGGERREVIGRDGRPMAVPQPGPMWKDDDAAVVQRSDIAEDWLAKVNAFAEGNGMAAPKRSGAQDGPKFSHAWVVGGKMTTTGSAVLVTDPQTPVRFPSIWQEFHVSGKTFNARGVGVPGCPGLLLGWNERVAWGATALGADQADLFRLKTDAAHPDQYMLDGEWRPMDVRRETIKVKGGEPVELVVRETVFGPVITAFAFANPDEPEVALKRVPVCSKDAGTFRAMLGMMRSRDVREFGAALSTWQFPSINLVYGDKDGRIGYQLLAAVPLRASQDAQQGAAAVDGSRSDMDWRGFVPMELLPRVVDPARGWIASANHRAIGTFYPVSMGLGTGSGGHTVRSWRLYELLGAYASQKMTPEQVRDVHFDCVNPARREIVRLGLHVSDVLEREMSADAVAALGVLEAWYTGGAPSDLERPGAEVAMEINTFFRLMSTPLAARYGGGESGLTRCLRDLGARLDKDPFAELSDDEQGFIDQALAGAWQSAKRKYGDDTANWRASARRAVRRGRLGTFDSLDGFGSLDRRTDLEVPGMTCVDGGTIKSQLAQSYTHYVPLHDVDQAQSLLPPGQSELAGTTGATSGMTLWGNGELRPAPLTRAAVERVAVSRIVLKPRGR